MNAHVHVFDRYDPCRAVDVCRCGTWRCPKTHVVYDPRNHAGDVVRRADPGVRSGRELLTI